MYGMLLQSIQHYVQESYGEEFWKLVAGNVGCPLEFNTHQIYDDTFIEMIANNCSNLSGGKTEQEFMMYFGRCFVKFFSCFGYETFVRASGRYFTDFLQNVDNIHLEMRFSYPKMDGPSMYVIETDSQGAVLVYRSSRSGFKHYLMGQLHEIAESMYKIELDVVVREEKISSGSYKINTLVLRLNYDNKEYMLNKNKKAEMNVRKSDRGKALRPMSSKLLLDLFPWAVMFGRSLRVLEAGDNLLRQIPRARVVKRPVTDFMKIRRPAGIPYTVNNLQDLRRMSLYLSDLNEHGLGRELVVRGWHNYSRLEQTWEENVELCKELERNHQLLEKWKAKGEQLLFSMIPRSVAEQLQRGESALSTCKSFESVSILFTEIVSLKSAVASVADVMTVVATMNAAFSAFDEVLDAFDAYKVETIGEVYMTVGGAPEAHQQHAEVIARVALAMRKVVPEIKAPLPIVTRSGIHTGPVVAGVVGLKAPRCCLFGDTVNTAARMQTTSKGMKIQVSEAFENTLKPLNLFKLLERGPVNIKGKGEMLTYWLEDYLPERDRCAQENSTCA